MDNEEIGKLSVFVLAKALIECDKLENSRDERLIAVARKIAHEIISVGEEEGIKLYKT